MLLIKMGLVCALLLHVHADPPSDSQQCLDYMKAETPEDANPVPALKISGHSAILAGTAKTSGPSVVVVQEFKADGGLPWIIMETQTVHYCGYLNTMEFTHRDLIDNKQDPVLLIRIYFVHKRDSTFKACVHVPVFVAQEEGQVNEDLEKYLRSQNTPDEKCESTHNVHWVPKQPAQMHLRSEPVTGKKLISASRTYDYYANCQYVSKDALKHVFEQFGWMKN